MTDARRPPAKPERRVRLDFRDHADGEAAQQEVRSNLSSITACGRCLWVSNDELATVERLLRQDDGGFAEHVVMQLAELFDLPEDEGGEMDIEGLDIADGYLWVVGSHSLTRAKPKPQENDAAVALALLSEVEHHPNRHFLGRIPLAEAAPDVFEARARVKGKGNRRHSGCLKISSDGNAIDKELRRDVHIARFMAVPAKENGFDIEGLAARGDRVLLGLRGPVLRGWAMLLQLEVEERKPGRLHLNKIGPAGQRYIKHFLDLEGLGIRELAFDGDALLILAGPTMDLDGPVVLYRWPEALGAAEQQVVPADQLEVVLELPYGRGFDHAEGICLLAGEGGAKELMVVYDSPAKDRLHAASAIETDVFALERRRPAREQKRPPRRAAVSSRSARR